MIDNIFNYIVLVQTKALFLLVLAFAIVLLLKQFQAAHRQLVWRQLVALLAALPVLIMVLPAINIDLPSWRNTPLIAELPKREFPLTGPLSPTHQERLLSPTDTAQLPVAKPAVKQAYPWKTIVVGAYLLGALYLSLRLFVGLTRAHVRIRKLATIKLPDLTNSMEARVNTCPETPFVWGFVKPVIVVPSDFSRYSQALQRNILHHEQTHIRNKDWLFAVVAKFCCCIYWFNPLVWQLARQSQLEAEKICDEQVVASGKSEEIYAEQLVQIARILRKPTQLHSWAPSMAGTSSLRHRIDNLLINCRRRHMRPFTQHCLKITLFSASLLLIAINGQSQTPEQKQNVFQEPSERPAYVRLHAETPAYPKAAARGEIEGHTVVEYTISASGKVINPRIVESVPEGVFDRVSLDAIQQWLYMPAYVDGKATATHLVRNKLTFKLGSQPKVSISDSELDYLQNQGPRSPAEATTLVNHYLANNNAEFATQVAVGYLQKTKGGNVSDALRFVQSLPVAKLDQTLLQKYIAQLQGEAEAVDSGDGYALLAQFYRTQQNWPAAQLALAKAFERGQLSDPLTTKLNLSVVLYNTHKYAAALEVVDALIAEHGGNERLRQWREVVDNEHYRQAVVTERLVRSAAR